MATRDDAAEDVFLPGGQLRGDRVDPRAEEALAHALRLASETCWDRVRSPHVFMGLLAMPDDGVRAWGERLGADLPRLLGQFQELFQQEEGDPDAILRLNREFLSDNVVRLLREAYQRARENRRQRITPMDVLITLLTTPKSIVAECFEHIGFTAARLTELAVLAEVLGKGSE